MSRKRRTKKEKILARLKRQISLKDQALKAQKTANYSYNPGSFKEKNPQTAKKIEKQLVNHPRLIKKDLIKTVFTSIILIGVIFFLFWYWQTGYQIIKLPF